MESIQHLKKRLKSVKNINQVTHTMEMVSAIKMRKSQELALASRHYALTALDLLKKISTLDNELPELLVSRKEIKKVLFVVVSSDKGLAGAFNSLVFKKLEDHTLSHREKYQSEEKVYLAVGAKASQYLLRKKVSLVHSFTKAGDYADPKQVRPIAEYIINGYETGQWDRVVIVSMHFKTVLRQEAMVRRILPVTAEHIQEIITEIIPQSGKFSELTKEYHESFLTENSKRDYLLEPSPKHLLHSLVSQIFLMEIYHLILEANASEHSARRMAMKTASDNAKDIADALALQYNKSRQAQITKEIIEITSGSEALN